MTLSAYPSVVSWMVGWSVGLTLCHRFRKGREVSLLCSYLSTCSYNHSYYVLFFIVFICNSCGLGGRGYLKGVGVVVDVRGLIKGCMGLEGVVG